MKTSLLSIEICRALVAWHKRHGRYWRTKLRSAWLRTDGYGCGLSVDEKAGLQQLRNRFADRLEALDMVEIHRRVHHADLKKATQDLIDELCPGGLPSPSYHAREKTLKVIGLLQESEAHYG